MTVKVPWRSTAELLSGVSLVLVLVAAVYAEDSRPEKVPASLIKEDLYSASFVTPDEGWVVGTFGSIYYTADGGKGWVKQETGTLSPLFSVSFADARHGWAVGKAGIVLHTADGGHTWRQKSVEAGKHLFAVDAVSPTIAWAVGDWGKIATTSDGGVTWQDRSLSNDVILYAVDFADQQHGWIAGEVGHLLSTEDGGQTWTQQLTDTGKSLFGVHVADRERAWAVGLDGEVWRLAGGQWERQTSGVKAALYDIAADGDEVWAVGDTGTAIASKDGGLTWNMVEVPDDLKLFWMHTVSVARASDTLRGFIGGANGLMLWLRNERIIAN